jgi:uncharacterized LabA/DUF88 family protein
MLSFCRYRKNIRMLVGEQVFQPPKDRGLSIFRKCSMTEKKVVILIDGGFLRSMAKKAKLTYDPEFIAKFAANCRIAGEEILRILYYDCAPFVGDVKLPVSGSVTSFKGDSKWLDELAGKDLFAVRKGVLKFRGYKPKDVPVSPNKLTDSDFVPDFEQKGVDMRIGLDIAAYSAAGRVDRILLVTNDTDCVPAMKYGRKAGIQMLLIHLPNCNPAKELPPHADFIRLVQWP